MQRQAHVVIAGCFVSLATAEWLRDGAAVWAALAVVAGLVAVALVVRTSAPGHKMGLAAALASVLHGVILGGGALRVYRIECCWQALHERRLTAASRSLRTALGQSTAEARLLVERGAPAAALPPEA